MKIADVIVIDGGADDDVIYNIPFYNEVSDVTIDSGAGNDKIISYGESALIKAVSGTNTIYAGGTNSTVIGGTDGDHIINGAPTVDLSDLGFGEGEFGGGDNNSLIGGDGNDTIENYSSNVSIDAGAGADLIKLHDGTGANITLGAEGDTISVDSAVKDFTVSDFTAGDEIQLAEAVDELKIVDGKLIAGEISISGIDSIATIENDWITTENGFVYRSWSTEGAKFDGTKIIYNTDTAKTNLFELNGLKSGLTVDEISAAIEVSGTTITIKDGNIFDTGKEITAPSGYDLKITDTSGYYASDSGNGYILANNTDNYSDLIQVYEVTIPSGVTAMGNPVIKYNGKIYAVGNVTFYGVKKGYVINSANITSDTTITASLDTSDGKHYAVGNANDGYTLATADNIGDYPNLTQVYAVTLPSGVNIASGIYAEDDSGKIYATGNITFSSETDIKGLERGDGGNYTVNIDSDVEFEFLVITSLTLTDSDASAITLAADDGTVDASARTKAIKIVGNERNNSIAGGSGNDTLDGGLGDDTLTGNAGADTFIYSGGADVITDYAAGEYSYEISGNDLILNFGDGKLTIKDAANTPITPGGASKKFTAEGVMTGAATAITLYADVATYTADDSVVTIDGSAVTGELKVVGNDKSNRIYAGKGNSTLIGGKGNDYLYSGDGADTFVYEHTEQEKISYTTVEGGRVEEVVSTIYSSGSDVFYNYGTDDKISLASGVELKDAYKRNDDVIIKVDSGAITVKDTDTVALVQDGEEIIFSGGVFSKPDTLILPATYHTNDVTLDSDTKNLDASKRTSATKLTGNELDNSIVGGKSSDTLDGGDGNDTLTGGAGNDVFVYDSGEDEITDYGTGSDKISAASDYQSYSIEGNDIIFNFGEGNSLTVKDGVGKSINFNGVAKAFAADKIFNSKGTAVTLGANTTTYTADETVVTIDGSQITGDAILTGNAKSNYFYGGTGANVFNCVGGSDVICNYKSGDTVSLNSAIKDFYMRNGDLIVKLESGTITVKNSNAVKFSFDGKEFSFNNDVLVDGDSVSIPATFANEFTLDAEKTNLDASMRTSAIKLTGNDNNNILIGGAKADTLLGNGGNDVIEDYGTGTDKISTTSDFTSYTTHSTTAN